jgi:hypothetical protein
MLCVCVCDNSTINIFGGLRKKSLPSSEEPQFPHWEKTILQVSKNYKLLIFI